VTSAANDGSPLDLEHHFLGEVAARYGRDHARYFVGGSHQVRYQLVQRGHAGCPGTACRAHGGALVHAALLPHDPPHANELTGEVLVQTDHVVQELPRATQASLALVFEAHREVTPLHGLQDLHQLLDFGTIRAGRSAAIHLKLRRRFALSVFGRSPSACSDRFGFLARRTLRARAPTLTVRLGSLLGRARRYPLEASRRHAYLVRAVRSTTAQSAQPAKSQHRFTRVQPIVRAQQPDPS
jgi:hypothetical protein